VSRRGRGRPSVAAGRTVTRERVLAEAARMFGEQGYGGASMRGLAERLGVAQGTLQHLFPTKIALWDAMVDEVLVPAYSVPVPESAFVAFAPDVVRARVDAAITRPGLSAAILFDRSEGHEARLLALGARLRGVQEQNLAALAGLAASGVIRVRDTEAVAAVLSVLLPTLSSAAPALQALFGLDLSDPGTRERIALAATDLLLRGLLEASADGPAPDPGRSDAPTADPP
jgi:AcrR family transcriptional regulator